MKRPFVVLGLLLLVAGCASRKPLAPDPFFGKTAISPPGTRSFERLAARDPYYAASQPPAAASQDLTPGNGGMFPDRVASWQSVNNRERSADGVRRASSWDIPPETNQAGSTARHASHTDASSQSVVRVMQPRAVATVAQTNPPVAVVQPASSASPAASVALVESLST
ncbi:MAG: lipoprotein, partial [Pirellulaceae bacterium]|nr:lipoprotein [Pirellulaceae bacterium]